ncbi:MAG TPA: hypothetical protein VFY17_02510, partial [Pilimelia sp.]|nr:hypothetical protein [Pilimelia sp.]
RLIWLFGRSAATRRLCRPLVRLRRLVRDVGGAVDRRLYMPLYGVVRPLVLARLAVRAYGPRLPAAADAVVACDTLAVTFAARLARRYPQAVATTGTRLQLPAGAAA